MEQTVLHNILEAKAVRQDGKRNFVVFLTPSEQKTVAYIEFVTQNPGFTSVQNYLGRIPVQEAYEILNVMDAYGGKKEGGR